MVEEALRSTERSRVSGRRSKRKADAGRRVRPTPIPISVRVRSVLIVAAVIVLLLVGYVAPAVPLTAAGGFVLALALSFPVRLLSRFLPRGIAVAATFAGSAGLVALFFAVLVPLVGDQIGALLADAPGVAAEAERTLRGLLGQLVSSGIVTGEPDELFSGLVKDLSEDARGLFEGLLADVFGLVGDAFSLALGLLGTAVVAAYMLADARGIKAASLRAAPKRYRRDAEELWGSFGHTLSRYLSGTVFVMFVQGALSALGLWALDVPYAFALGTWVALTALVPVLGAWVGAVPGLLVALAVSPTTAAAAAVLFLVIQQLEGNVLTPRVMGGILKVHPVFVMLAVVGAGEVAGITGILLAMPVLGVLRVLLDFFGARLETALPRPDEGGGTR